MCKRLHPVYRQKQLNGYHLDISKAFDTVPMRRLLHKLEHLGIHGNLNLWIESFVSEILQRAGDSFSEERPVISGIPQGSVLGP